jgi:uncharacterized membrane protein (UPF0127 family)
MLIKKIFLYGLIIFLCFSCASKLERLTVSIKGINFDIECARTTQEKARGLMHRKKLSPRKGMLFIYPNDVRGGFWMKNTYIPLSIAFLSERGEILDIKDMEPLSTKSVYSRFPYRYALEVNKGAFDKINVQPGDYVVFPRGFK